MPRYEFAEGGSSKFWEIELAGNTFTVRFGKIGTDGQASTKVFGSPAEAKKEHDKLVASKVKKGYQPVAAVERAPEPGRNDALEQALLADPDDRQAWLVYADWLQAQDDPRGAFVAAAANGKDTRKLLEANSKDFLGRFAGDMEPYVEIEWGIGFWKRVKAFCTYDTAEELPESSVKSIASVVGHVLRHPSARFLQALSIGLTEGVVDGEAEWRTCLDAVVKNGVRPSLRELFVGDYERVDDTEISWTRIGNHAGLWTVLPNLRHFKVQGCGIELGPIDAPNLESIRIWSGGLGKEPVEQIGKARLPNLQHLEIWFGSEHYGAECSADDVDPILAGTGLPALRSLGLMNSEFADELPAHLARSAILPRLHRLDLSMGTLTDDGARTILANAAKFAHLSELNLSDNFITKDTAAQLAKALPKATVDGQKGADGDYRYVSVGE